MGSGIYYVFNKTSGEKENIKFVVAGGDELQMDTTSKNINELNKDETCMVRSILYNCEGNIKFIEKKIGRYFIFAVENKTKDTYYKF